MITAYTTSASTPTALYILRLAIRHSRPISSAPFSNQSASPAATVTPAITPQMLPRLHRLSALNPPVKDSDEETKLLKELNELVSLMDGVKDVVLPLNKDELGSLLSEGVGEVHIGHDDLQLGKKADREMEKEDGRKLLSWATRRVGDYYATRLEKKSGL
jgi:hypothetical protein